MLGTDKWQSNTVGELLVSTGRGPPEWTKVGKYGGNKDRDSSMLLEDLDQLVTILIGTHHGISGTDLLLHKNNQWESLLEFSPTSTSNF